MNEQILNAISELAGSSGLPRFVDVVAPVTITGNISSIIVREDASTITAILNDVGVNVVGAEYLGINGMELLKGDEITNGSHGFSSVTLASGKFKINFKR